MRDYSPNIFLLMKSRGMKWAGIWHERETRGARRVVMGKPERKRPLGGPRSKWEDNIKINLYEIG